MGSGGPMTDVKSELALAELADRCIRLSLQPRPEAAWMESVCRRFMEEHGLSGKAELDQLLFERTYSAPANASGALKIRYWRTGRHMPSKRSDCEKFARAIASDETEKRRLMQQYFDRCDRSFSGQAEQDPLYRERREYLNRWAEEYLARVHPSRMLQAGVTPESLKRSLRHLYFLDCSGFVSLSGNVTVTGLHSVSVGYDAEFRRNFSLAGEIPRKTMLRHLIVLGIPFLNAKRLSRGLETMGYFPLEETHAATDGQRLDALVLGLFRLYERVCSGRDPEDCSAWFREASRFLDRYCMEHKAPGLRFMYFKALGQGDEGG